MSPSNKPALLSSRISPACEHFSLLKSSIDTEKLKHDNNSIAIYDDMIRPYRKNSYIRKTGRLAFIFLLLFVTVTLATAFHHHEDGSEHRDCPVCAAGHHYFSTGVTAFSPANLQPVSSNELPAPSLLYDSARVSLLPCRAPPA